MMKAKKALVVIGIIVCALVAVAAIALLLYRDANLHADARLIEKAHETGMVEKQAQMNGSTFNYAEGPDNGPALLLMHGQSMAWEDYAKALPGLVKDFHVFAVDCYGQVPPLFSRSLKTRSRPNASAPQSLRPFAA